MIVTLQMIKDEIGYTDSDHDSMIQRKLDQAEAIIIDYLKVDSDEYEDVNGDNDFPLVIAATVIQSATLLYNDPTADPLPPAIKNVLMRLRDPALA